MERAFTSPAHHVGPFARPPGRATHDDRAVSGDDLLPNARVQVTHQIDIDARPEDVWPWLVQMGRRRGGWYSWDRLDNGGVPSADEIIPALQQLAVGDILPVKQSGPDGFAVLVLDAPRALVLGDPSLLPGRPTPRKGIPRGTWAFSLEPIGDTATHLVVRVRIDYEPSFVAALLRPMVMALHEIMERKQLGTLKERAEARPRRESSELGTLIGSGHKIGALMLPFLAIGLALNVLYPRVFSVAGPPVGLKMLSFVVLLFGIANWMWSVALILIKVPRRELITTGPYALVKHPLYTGMALLVLPWAGFLMNTWLGAILGIVLYVATRMFAPEEERILAKTFGTAWDEYCRTVKIPRL